MSFIYHGVPENMRGTTLMPLSMMQQEMPDLFQNQLKKYSGREEITERRIDLLNCLWTEVVQFLPLHPQIVFDLQKTLGLIPEVPPYRFFEIDLSELDPAHAAIYFKTAEGEENSQVKRLDEVDWENLQGVPPATRKYYASLVGTGELPFNYQFIPHVLYRGTVDISKARIIELSDQ